MITLEVDFFYDTLKERRERDLIRGDMISTIQRAEDGVILSYGGLYLAQTYYDLDDII